MHRIQYPAGYPAGYPVTGYPVSGRKVPDILPDTMIIFKIENN